MVGSPRDARCLGESSSPNAAGQQSHRALSPFAVQDDPCRTALGLHPSVEEVRRETDIGTVLALPQICISRMSQNNSVHPERSRDVT